MVLLEINEIKVHKQQYLGNDIYVCVCMCVSLVYVAHVCLFKHEAGYPNLAERPGRKKMKKKHLLGVSKLSR